MEFKIQHSNLIDSPFSTESSNNIFVFDEDQLSHLSGEIMLGNPTCYMMSGYRGVGKTSFIKKLESVVSADDKVLFVHTSFVKYKNQSFLFRKLIRRLYLKLEPTKSFQSLANSSSGKLLQTKLFLLYQRTFHDISSSFISQEQKEKEISFKINFDSLSISKFLTIILPTVILLVQALNGTNFLTEQTESYILSFFCFIVLVFGVLNITVAKNKIKKEEQNLLARTLYDDEIAEHHLNEVLDDLKSNNFKIVFVLDELDKVDDKDIKSLINEMKPLMVSGLASFIVVSGQKLFYRFFEDQLKNDSVLSSLFSKVIHVPLSSPAGLRELFYKHIVVGYEKFSDEEKKEIEFAVNYFIFQSRLVPRRFISLLRQRILYQNNSFILDTSILPKDYQKATLALEAIAKVQERYIIPDSFHRCIRDFMVMSVFINASSLLSEKKYKI